MKSGNRAGTTLLLVVAALSGLALAVASGGVPGVVINEVHHDSDPKTERAEFVELFNAGATSVDLSGWQLKGVGSHTFPAGTSLGSGQFLVVAEDIATMQSKFGVTTTHQYAGGLDSDAELLRLLDGAGTEIDRLDYKSGFPWPTAARGAGASMELLHPALDNDLGGAWRSSAGPPTPGAANSVLAITASAAPPAIRQVSHLPVQPGVGQEVTITAKVTDPDGVAAVTLSYQLVSAGSYIRKSDATYGATWTELPMLDAGTGGDAFAADDIYTVTIPAALQVHRRLVRYRITVRDAGDNTVRVPYADDESPNFAYFVHGGVPAWSGSDHPGTTRPQSVPAEVMADSLPVYHLIANSTDVTNSQYIGGYDGVRMWGTMVYDGVVYDHIQFYNRGEASTYRSGKNKWRFKFNRTRDFEARDIHGKRYKTDWKTLNFNACASPWIPVNRGMAGFDEAVPQRLYQLAGVVSSNTHWVHFRVVDERSEAPADQYAGDLWGLYLAVEHPDGRFLTEHDLPDGSTYKIQGGVGDKKNQGPTQSVDSSDWTSFWNDSASLLSVRWWRAKFDLDSFYGFRAINRATGNVDLRDETNYYMYHHPSGRWHVIPWDLDMMYIPETHWSGVIRADTCLDHGAINIEFKNRCRELADLLFSDRGRHGGQAAQVVEEFASVLNPPGVALSMVDVDQFMWNHNPRTAGDHLGQWYVTPKSQGQRGGTWERTLPTPDHEGFQQNMIDYMYDTPRGGAFAVGDGDERGYGFGYLSMEAADSAIPDQPTISYSGMAGFPLDGLRFTSSAFSDPGGAGTFASMQWRAGEISNPATSGFVAGEPWVYEAEGSWDSGQITTFAEEITLPVGVLRTGHTYRVRVRHFDATGRASHWSEPLEFTATLPDLSTYLGGLVITEVMYHPSDPTAAEFAAGFTDDDDFEYIELRNVGPVALDLADLRLTRGIDFDFLGSAVTSLAPGEFVLVVSNRAAIEMRYGLGLPIAGEWESTDKLDNGGEQLKLSFGAGDAIRDFVYDDVAPWPTEPDGTGASLTLSDPFSVPDHALATNWQASSFPQGTPGVDDPTGPFAEWMAARNATDPDAPFGTSSLSHLLAYAVGADLAVVPGAALPSVARVEDGGIVYPALRYRVRQDGSEIAYFVEVSEDLVSWKSGGAHTTQVGAPEDNGDGTVTLTVRSLQPVASRPNQFLRLRVALPGMGTSPFAAWMSARGATDPDAPFGTSSLSHLLAYAVGADLAVVPGAALPSVALVDDGGTVYPALRYRVRQDASEIVYFVEVSEDLMLWQSGGAHTVQVGVPEDNGDGTVTLTVRSLQAVASRPNQFLRLRVILAP
ncbi:MAG: lamin tail domain-containing protein [Verrucomicrobia bacterium]|nr:lamin tail domain-containing protein [Verrucomicrobiota bacterium]